jgi:hypothetical protein
MKLELGKLKKFLDDGYSVITIGEKKIPNIPWKIRQEVPFTKDSFEEAYELESTKGQGFCTGYNGLEVFDIDLKVLPTLQKQTEFWNEYLSFLQDNIADFEDKFVIYKTVSNGYHILYRCEQVGGNQKIATLSDCKEAIIETRGIGGYVFIYERKVSKLSYSEIQTISIHDREVLFGVSKYFDSKKDIITENPVNEVVKKVTEYNENEIKPWDDFNEKTTVWELIESDFTIVRRLKNKNVIKRHGATSEHSGYIFNDTGFMFLFSTGTIYPNETLLSPFQVFTYKYFNGDFKEASKDIYSKGFGSRIVKKVEQLERQIEIKQEDLVFPIEIFPTSIQNYMLECNRTLSSSIDYMGCSMLWLMSIIIGNTVKCEVKKGWIESVNIWLAIVGKAGVGKSHNLDIITYPLNFLNNLEIKKYSKNCQRFNEYNALTKKEKAETEHIEQPIKSQFIVSDITLEALVQLHSENKNGIAVMKDELAGWFKDMNKYRAGSDLEFWLSSWSNKAIALNRKTSESNFVSSPIIPILGGIQPSVLSQVFTIENKDNGFIDRVLTSFPNVKIEEWNDEEMDEEILEWYKNYIITLFQSFKKVLKTDNDGEIIPIIARFNSDAKEELKRIFNEITTIQNSEDENEYMKSMLPKQKSYIPRFALMINTLQVFDNDKNEPLYFITKESILKAEKLSKYFISMAKKIKINSTEVNEYKETLSKNKALSKKERVIQIYKENPEFNRSEVAELIGVSRQSIQNYIKEL